LLSQKKGEGGRKKGEKGALQPRPYHLDGMLAPFMVAAVSAMAAVPFGPAGRVRKATVRMNVSDNTVCYTPRSTLGHALSMPVRSAQHPSAMAPHPRSGPHWAILSIPLLPCHGTQCSTLGRAMPSIPLQRKRVSQGEVGRDLAGVTIIPL